MSLGKRFAESFNHDIEESGLTPTDQLVGTLGLVALTTAVVYGGFKLGKIAISTISTKLELAKMEKKIKERGY